MPVYNTKKCFSDTICPPWKVWVAICSCLCLCIFASWLCNTQTTTSFSTRDKLPWTFLSIKKTSLCQGGGSAQLLNEMRRAWFDWLRLMPEPDTATDNVFLIKPSSQLRYRCQLCHRCLVPGCAREVTSCATCTVDCTGYHAPLTPENRDHCFFFSHMHTYIKSRVWIACVFIGIRVL